MDVIFRLKVFAVVMAVFWALIYIIDRRYDLEARGMSISPGFLMWRTDKGVGFLDRLSKKFKRFWSSYGVLCSIIGITIMVLFFYIFARGILEGVWRLLTPAENIPIPSGAKERPVPIPGVNIPFLVGIISLGTALLVHEPAHGVLFRRLKLKIKSVGLAVFLFVIPGAFVEEDEEEFKESPPWKRIRIASAGPVSNIFLGGSCLILVMVLINPLSGIYTSGIVSNSAADNAGLKPGVKLAEIDGREVENYDTFDGFMEDTYPGQTINITTDEGYYSITLGKHPSENIGFLGVRTAWSYFTWEDLDPRVAPTLAFYEVIGRPVISKYAYDSPLPWGLVKLLKWIFALNLLVGIFNLLPLKPLDGGHIIEGISEKLTSKSTAGVLANAISGVTLVFILLNFLIIYA